MTITLEIPKATETEIRKRAKSRGQDVQSYVLGLVERDVLPSWGEIVKPIHDEFKKSGMTQEELDEFTDELIREVRAEKPLNSR